MIICCNLRYTRASRLAWTRLTRTYDGSNLLKYLTFVFPWKVLVKSNLFGFLRVWAMRDVPSLYNVFFCVNLFTYFNLICNHLKIILSHCKYSKTCKSVGQSTFNNILHIYFTSLFAATCLLRPIFNQIFSNRKWKVLLYI